jgi:phosphoserine phosphatase
MLILSDFSKTFTRPDMPTTWSVFAKSGLLGEAYIADRDTLYAANIGYETSWNIEMTEQWFLEHAQLFVKYWLTQEMIDQIVLDDRYFAPREGVREFLDYLIREDIPLVIVTSGVSDFVTAWFLERYNYSPEIVFGNELIMDEDIVVWVVEESIMTPLDKAIELESDGDEIIVIGDSSEDVSVVQGAKISIGFTDEERGFTVKLGKDASMAAVISYLR